MILTKDFLEKQKKALIEEKKRIEEKIKNLNQYPDYGWDEEDRIRELTDYENNQPLEDQLKIILEKINQALTAIENGTYGLCIKCKSAIERGRLKAMPYADICVSCTPKK